MAQQQQPMYKSNPYTHSSDFVINQLEGLPKASYFEPTLEENNFHDSQLIVDEPTYPKEMDFNNFTHSQPQQEKNNSMVDDKISKVLSAYTSGAKQNSEFNRDPILSPSNSSSLNTPPIDLDFHGSAHQQIENSSLGSSSSYPIQSQHVSQSSAQSTTPISTSSSWNQNQNQRVQEAVQYSQPTSGHSPQASRNSVVSPPPQQQPQQHYQYQQPMMVQQSSNQQPAQVHQAVVQQPQRYAQPQQPQNQQNQPQQQLQTQFQQVSIERPQQQSHQAHAQIHQAPIVQQSQAQPVQTQSPQLSQTQLLYVQNQQAQQAQQFGQAQQQLLQQANMIQAYFDRIMRFMENVDHRLGSLEKMTDNILRSQQDGTQIPISNAELDNARRAQEQLEADMEAARKLQESFDSEFKSSSSSMTKPPVPNQECPICNVKMTLAELQAHIEPCLEKESRNNGPKKIEDQTERKTFLEKLFGRNGAMPAKTATATPTKLTTNPVKPSTDNKPLYTNYPGSQQQQSQPRPNSMQYMMVNPTTGQMVMPYPYYPQQGFPQQGYSQPYPQYPNMNNNK